MVAAAGPPLRIAFFGTPEFAVPSLRELLNSRHRVCGVITQPDRRRGRGQQVTASPVKALAAEHGLPVFQPDRLRDPGVTDTISAWSPDLGVVVAYGQILPEELLALPPLGVINVHASLLPKYRGAAPVHRAVIDGERDTGVTIMRVVKALDAGGMFATAVRPIGPDETSDVLERDLAQLGGALLMTVVEQLAAGTARDEPQDERLATYASRLTKEEGLVDWSLPALRIHNRVRGLYPWPHAYTYLDGTRIILRRTHLESRRPEITTSASEAHPDAAAASASEARPGETRAPGTIAAVTPDAIHVVAGDGQWLAIDELQLEGRRPVRTREFLAGRAITPGARFSSS